ncbi:DUF255 domain-containing protein [Sphingobacterium sp. DK4209]|uniref:DUF255 domain-containing protein n=1 Tax=Sphingobacterium zhuxiongii TaxID=2662364 RepID=A0A5Q0QC77_9SPHI|nr:MULTISPECIES: thioredoxin family protein [unclassified Sphingobacterium]MVZ67155.1 DUF255 domain-containing protein [Sphingobacterium sp. DK4209]QGA26884.1 DUF255 domain-containing protein [Sphingobacterium sp. dk4302]
MKGKILPLFYSAIILGLGLISVNAHAQTEKPKETAPIEKPYHPEADPQADLDKLITQSQKENKNIIVQAGGNWCFWCLKFNQYIHENEAVAKVVNDNFLYYHANYSKENENKAFFEKYAPKGPALGFPFFIVLDPNGKVLNVRESGNLEKDKSYDQEKVLAFFNTWVRK